MKKITLIFIVSIFLISNLIAAEKKTNVFHGYQEVKWGSSLETVKKYYKNLERYPNNEIINVCWRQKKPNNIIEERSFWFYRDQLYRVKIEFHWYITKEQWKIICQKTIEKFGPPHNPAEMIKQRSKEYAFWYDARYSFNNNKMAVCIQYKPSYPLPDPYNDTIEHIDYYLPEIINILEKKELKAEKEKAGVFKP